MEALLVMVLVTWVFVEYKSAGEVKEEELLLLLLLLLFFCCSAAFKSIFREAS